MMQLPVCLAFANSFGVAAAATRAAYMYKCYCRMFSAFSGQ